ncbi:phage tail assembly chaperone [Qipengyuania aestuarii]|uniref:phage tail assembly chaperone n=1 Tax=Qipengyuania aestuarii TaxID=2867241 RepID=UPI0031E7119E
MADFSVGARRLAGLSARALGWPPDIFWNATPEDLALSLGTHDPAVAPPSRAEIAAMMERDRNGR